MAVEVYNHTTQRETVHGFLFPQIISPKLMKNEQVNTEREKKTKYHDKGAGSKCFFFYDLKK